MKLKFKKLTYSKKVKKVDGIMHNVTYCTVICMIETPFTEIDIWKLGAFTKHMTEIEKSRKNFVKFSHDRCTKDRHINKIISVGGAIKSTTDIDNPKLGEKLAEARAKLQCYRYAETLCNAMYHCLKELAFGNLLVSTNCPECTSNGGMYDQWLYYQNLVEREKYHISKLLSQL